MFQFQYGTIKSKISFNYLSIYHCFNSNMVRLKDYLTIKLKEKIMFQFQYGTIKRLRY